MRARYAFLKDIDAPSSFFFSLEKRVRERKQMHCLKLPDGRLSYDRGEKMEAAVFMESCLVRGTLISIRWTF